MDTRVFISGNKATVLFEGGTTAGFESEARDWSRGNDVQQSAPSSGSPFQSFDSQRLHSPYYRSQTPEYIPQNWREPVYTPQYSGVFTNALPYNSHSDVPQPYGRFSSAFQQNGEYPNTSDTWARPDSAHADGNMSIATQPNGAASIHNSGESGNFQEYYGEFRSSTQYCGGSYGYAEQQYGSTGYTNKPVPVYTNRQSSITGYTNQESSPSGYTACGAPVYPHHQYGASVYTQQVPVYTPRDSVVTQQVPVYSPRDSVVTQQVPVYTPRGSVVTQQVPVYTQRDSVVTQQVPVYTPRDSVVTQQVPVYTPRDSVVTQQVPVYTPRDSVVTQQVPVYTPRDSVVTQQSTHQGNAFPQNAYNFTQEAALSTKPASVYTQSTYGSRHFYNHGSADYTYTRNHGHSGVYNNYKQGGATGYSNQSQESIQYSNQQQENIQYSNQQKESIQYSNQQQETSQYRNLHLGRAVQYAKLGNETQYTSQQLYGAVRYNNQLLGGTVRYSNQQLQGGTEYSNQQQKCATKYSNQLQDCITGCSSQLQPGGAKYSNQQFTTIENNFQSTEYGSRSCRKNETCGIENKSNGSGTQYYGGVRGFLQPSINVHQSGGLPRITSQSIGRYGSISNYSAASDNSLLSESRETPCPESIPTAVLPTNQSPDAQASSFTIPGERFTSFQSRRPSILRFASGTDGSAFVNYSGMPPTPPSQARDSCSHDSSFACYCSVHNKNNLQQDESAPLDLDNLPPLTVEDILLTQRFLSLGTSTKTKILGG